MSELWHVLNRGVDKRKVVLDDTDRARFVHDLFVFNDSHPVQHILQPQRRDLHFSSERILLIHIHAFCLMENHYHLLISEAVKGGIPQFLKKLNMGYAKYFNEKYARTGALWQGKTKKILITRDAHYMYVPYYIHLNPLDYTVPAWRDGNVKDIDKALRALKQYRWSSHLDYLGVHNFPSITRRNIIGDLFISSSNYQKEIAHIIGDPSIALPSSLIEY